MATFGRTLQMRRRSGGEHGVLLAVVVLIVGASIAAPVGAQTFQIVSSSRNISAYGSSYCPGCGPNGEDTYYSNGDSDGTTSPGTFGSSVGSLGSNASQLSVLDADELSGGGDIGVGGSGDNDASSTLSVTFQVVETGLYEITGELFEFGSEYIAQNYVALALAGGPDLFRAEFTNGAFGDMVTLQSGILYELTAATSGFGTGSGGGASWQFALGVVPEPGTAMLVGLGLMALAYRSSSVGGR